MVDCFSDVEIEQLNALFKELLSPKLDYFLKRLRADEIEMLRNKIFSVPWNYLRSSFNLIISFFVNLGQAVYLSLKFDFPLAGHKYCNATRMAMAAVIKLLLSLALFFLNTIRLITITLITFLPQVVFLSAISVGITVILSGQIIPGGGLLALTILGFILNSALNYSRKKVYPANSNIIQELQVLDRITDEIYLEKDEIVKKLNNIASSPEVNSVNKNRYQLFATKRFSKKSNETNQLVEDLCQALNSYPQFIARRVDEIGYVSSFISELEEHHEKTTQMANIYFTRLDEADRSARKNGDTTETENRQVISFL